MTETASPRVDAHHHVWDIGVRDQPWTADLPALRRSFSMADLRPHLVQHRIDASVVVQTLCIEQETRELLRLAAATEIGGVVGWVDLASEDVADRLAALVRSPGGHRLVGIRHQVQSEPDPRWLCRADVRRGLAAVADAGLVYDLVVTPTQLPAVVDTVQTMPQVRFVLDHAGKPPIASRRAEPWATDLADLARCPNTTVKLSGLVTEADHRSWAVPDVRPFATHVLECFGAERVMFGSDWPVCTLAADYDAVVDLTEQLLGSCTPEQRADVFGGTATTVYGLQALR